MQLATSLNFVRSLMLIAPLSSVAVGQSGPGTEDLVTPRDITIAAAADLVTGSVSLHTQPGVLSIPVPTGAVIRQALLYWQGYDDSPTGGDDTIEIGGKRVTGVLVGGPTRVCEDGSDDCFSFSYRADVTSLRLVTPGANMLTVLGADFERPTGAALVVSLAGRGSAPVQVREGNDVASFRLDGDLNETEKETFKFRPASAARKAELALVVGNIAAANAAGVWVAIGNADPVVRWDVLQPSGDAVFNSVILPLDIPAGVDTVQVRLLSSFDPSQNAVASLTPDEFTTLDAKVWDFVNPLNDDSAASATGSQLKLLAHASNQHDPWTQGNHAPRFMRSAANGDFQVEVKFDSNVATVPLPAGSTFQMQGIMIEESEGNYLRVEFHRVNTQFRFFAAHFVNNVPTVRQQASFARPLGQNPMYLRVSRKGDSFTTETSFDGHLWTVMGTFSHELAVTKVGLHSGNSKDVEHCALVDYFFVNKAGSTDGTPADLVWVNATLSVPDAAPTTTCHLTPGFWKKHLGLWKAAGLSPDDIVAKVFSHDRLRWPAGLGSLGKMTLREALCNSGGSGLQGVRAAFLQQAVAALLNASHPNVRRFYPTHHGRFRRSRHARFCLRKRQVVFLTNWTLRCSKRCSRLVYFRARFLRIKNWYACINL